MKIGSQFTYLIITLGICSGMLLVERFVVDIPLWLAVILITIALLSLIIFFLKSLGKKKEV